MGSEDLDSHCDSLKRVRWAAVAGTQGKNMMPTLCVGVDSGQRGREERGAG